MLRLAKVVDEFVVAVFSVFCGPSDDNINTQIIYFLYFWFGGCVWDAI